MSVATSPGGNMPALTNIVVGQMYYWNDIGYTVTNVLEASYVGTEGELPFTTTGKRQCTFVDLQNTDGGMATIDGTESPSLLYTGEFVAFDDLALQQLREFEGW
jgi:hypothetical protein